MLGHRAVGTVELVDGEVELLAQRALGTGEALEEDLDRGAALEARELRLDVGEHADLRRRAGVAAQAVEVGEQAGDVVDGVDRRVETDEAVAGAEAQAGVDEQGDAVEVVRRVVGLQPRGQRAALPDRRARGGGRPQPAGDQDELVDVHELREGGGLHAGQPAADTRDLLAVAAQQAVLELAQGEVRDLFVRVGVDLVVDAHHGVDAPLVVGQRAFVEVADGELGEDRAGRLARHLVLGVEARQAVARLAGVGRAQQRLQAGEAEVAIEQAELVVLVCPRLGHRDLGQGRQLVHRVSSLIACRRRTRGRCRRARGRR